jgi:5'-3' exonuclease
MRQPIPKRILESKPELAKVPYNTLLIDGSNLMEVCWAASDEVSSNGKRTGGIYQFLFQVRALLERGHYKHCYCLFDGDSSGQLRYERYPMYKANRDKTFSDDNLSDYMKEVNARIRSMQQKLYKKPKRTESEKENFFWQRDVVIRCLEELFVRVVCCDKTEADDFIGYYVSHKEPNERIVICSNDRDLTQLISADVIVYIQSMHEFINTRNHTEKLGYDYRNVKLKKVICGDTSDNIKGIKGVGEKTLFENFPEIREREVTLEEVVGKARRLNEERVEEKKKPLKWAENIVNAVTDGCQGDRVYEVNDEIIDLKNPLMTEESKELIESYMGSPMDPDGRSFANLYGILMEAGVDSFRDESRFGNFFNIFNYLIDSEKKFAQSVSD